jgi:hypothetical protein
VGYSFNDSINRKALGRYFGVRDSNAVVIGALERADPAEKQLVDKEINVDYQFLVHLVCNFHPKVTFTLKPYRSSHVLNLDYYRDTSALLNYSFFAIHLPVVHVNHTPSYNFTSQGFEDNQELQNDIKNYLEGNYENSTENSLQSKLTNAKIPTSKKSSTGFSDITLSFGTHFLNQRTHRGTVALNGIIPLGNKPKCEYLFEPIRGNGGHFGLGIMGEYLHTAWEGTGQIDIITSLNYYYLFSNNQKRILGIKNKDWGQYYLLGQNGQNTLIPAANVLTQNVKASPCFGINSQLALAYAYKTFAINLGYSIHIKEEENIKLKDKFPENTYGLAAFNFDTANQFDNTPDNFYEEFNAERNWLSKDNIDLKTTQSAFTICHTLSCWGTKTFDISKYYFNFSIGIDCDVNTKNSPTQQIGLWTSLSSHF